MRFDLEGLGMNPDFVTHHWALVSLADNWNYKCELFCWVAEEFKWNHGFAKHKVQAAKRYDWAYYCREQRGSCSPVTLPLCVLCWFLSTLLSTPEPSKWSALLRLTLHQIRATQWSSWCTKYHSAELRSPLQDLWKLVLFAYGNPTALSLGLVSASCQILQSSLDFNSDFHKS